MGSNGPTTTAEWIQYLHTYPTLSYKERIALKNVDKRALAAWGIEVDLDAFQGDPIVFSVDVCGECIYQMPVGG